MELLVDATLHEDAQSLTLKPILTSNFHDLNFNLRFAVKKTTGSSFKSPLFDSITKNKNLA